MSSADEGVRSSEIDFPIQVGYYMGRTLSVVGDAREPLEARLLAH